MRYNPDSSMWEFRAENYGARIAEILALAGDGRRRMGLVVGRCVSTQARDLVGRWKGAALFDERPLRSADFAEAARSGLYLYLDCFEESHAIAQNIGSATGSYWHGILHRREPDFDNARYWFRRVKDHPIFPRLRESWPRWEPLKFIEECEQLRRRPDSAAAQALEETQLAEWQLLLDYCCREAVELGGS